MKSKLYIAAFAIALGSAFVSCDDFLEAENKSAGGKTADNYFSTAEGVAMYRNYAYVLLRPLVNNAYNDMYDDGADLYWPSRGNGKTVFNYYNMTAENSTIKNYYSACYKLIDNCNGVLEYGGDTYAGEMKFLRAYGYYLLTQQFGSVPYVTNFIVSAERNYPRTPLNEIYSNILADLDEVIADENIPEISHDGTVNKKAAYALAAKVALAAGWDLNTTLVDAANGTYTIDSKEYFNKACSYAENALSGVTPLTDFNEKWSPKNEGNDEEFMAAAYDRESFASIGTESDGGHGLQNDYGSYYGAQNTEGSKQVGSTKVTSRKALYLWERGDQRYFGTFAGVHCNYDGNWPTTGYYAMYNEGLNSDTTGCNIALYYAPFYLSSEEFLGFLKTHKSQFEGKNTDNYTGKWVQASHAYRLSDPEIHVTFDDEGNIASIDSTSTSVAYNELSGILAATHGADCVKKWDDMKSSCGAGTSNDYRDVVFLHWGETVATAAEAYLLAGNEAKALEYVNKLRSRAGANTLTSFSDYDPSYISEGFYKMTLTALDVVLDERARELYGEPGRWMDLRRTKQMVRYYVAFHSEVFTDINSWEDLANAKGEVKWLRPIPADEIANNTSMTAADQNPGY